ncbi:hypothetical protein F5Y13DRAFT_159241 [Hypoxylon sp. FL1857]|nr:hypothetical protein F5Y13DRAFT_159241 [Hypoxylon sp. FL1857]
MGLCILLLARLRYVYSKRNYAAAHRTTGQPPRNGDYPGTGNEGTSWLDRDLAIEANLPVGIVQRARYWVPRSCLLLKRRRYAGTDWRRSLPKVGRMG